MTTSKSRNKTLRTVIGYAVLGLIVVVLLLYIFLRSRDRMQYELPALPPMEIEEVDGLELAQLDKTVNVAKKDGEWRIQPEDFKADDSEMLQLLRRINSLTLMDLVSVAENYNRYDLDENSRIRVTTYNGEEIVRQFDVGKRSATYNHTYVAIRGDTRVFHADGDFRRNFDKTKDALRDLLVLSFDLEEISEITATNSEGTTRLVKTMEKAVPEESQEEETSDSEESTEEIEQVVWRDEAGEAWEIELMDDMLDKLHNLDCMKYYKGDEASLGDPVLTIQLQGKKLYELKIYGQQEEGHPARSSENEYTFYVSSWNRDNLVKMFGDEEEGTLESTD